MRRMGKAGFAHLMQHAEKLQVYLKKDALSESAYALYQLLDLGDLIGVEGYLFRNAHGRAERPCRETRFPLENFAGDA